MFKTSIKCAEQDSSKYSHTKTYYFLSDADYDTIFVKLVVKKNEFESTLSGNSDE